MYQQHRLGGYSIHQANNQILSELLKALTADQPDRAELLSRHFLDGEKMQIIANSLNIGVATAHRRQKEAIQSLAQRLRANEDRARAMQRVALKNRLEPSSYTQLVGVEDHMADLYDLLTSPNPPWLIAISGIGGIGKTSLADAVSRHLIDQDAIIDFGWVSAKAQTLNPGLGITPVKKPALTAEELVERLATQLMPEMVKSTAFSSEKTQAALQARLTQAPHLIVVDNLETVQDLDVLLPALRALSGPTKFLLTSRKGLFFETGVYHYPLEELSETNTMRLIRDEIRSHNPRYLREASELELKQIFETVGGNPLAVRLVTGQAHIFPLNVILADLTKARGQKAENLYTHIYQQAWDRLAEPTREVFLILPLVAPGQGTLDHLAEVSQMAEGVLHDALNELVTLNLVDSKAGNGQPHYSIHGLTRTFLQKQVLKWL